MTEWVTALYFPVIPICSRRVRVRSKDSFNVIFYASRNVQYEIIERIPLRHNLRQVFLTWSFTLVPLAFLAVTHAAVAARMLAWVGLISALILGILAIGASLVGSMFLIMQLRARTLFVLLLAVASGAAAIVYAWAEMRIGREFLDAALKWVAETTGGIPRRP